MQTRHPCKCYTREHNYELRWNEDICKWSEVLLKAPIERNKVYIDARATLGGISSIEREPFAKFSGLRKIEIAIIVREGAFAKFTFRENLYVYGIFSCLVYVCMLMKPKECLLSYLCSTSEPTTMAT